MLINYAKIVIEYDLCTNVPLFFLLQWMDLCTIGCRFMQMNAYFLVMNSKRCNSHKLFFWWCMDIVRRKLVLVTIGSEICCIPLCVLHILGSSVPSIILADLLGNTCLLARVQKIMVCQLWLVDLDPFCLFPVTRFVALWSSGFGQ